jgi:hypothetical protein
MKLLFVAASCALFFLSGQAARAELSDDAATTSASAISADAGTVAATAQSPDGGMSAADTAAELAELKRRIEVLSQEVENQRQETTVVAPGTPMAPGLSPGAGKVYSLKSNGLSIGGYGETILSVYNTHLQNGQYEPTSNLADTLRAVLYVGYKFTDWLVFDSEYEFEHSGFSDEHAEGEAIVEFAWLDFLITPWFNVRMGQVLLPLGWINELHEPPIFLGVLRPQVEQETGIIPTTWHEIGVGIHGELPFGFNYRGYILNGLNSALFNADGTGSIGTGRQDGHQAIANKPAFTGRLDWKRLPGTTIGASFYAGNSNQAVASTPVWTTLWDVHAEYRGYGFQARALYTRLTNSPDGVETYGTGNPAFEVGTLQSGWYVEAGFDVFSLFPSIPEAIIPFVRVEWLNTQQAVAPGATQNLANQQTIVTVGINYKPIPQVAIKTDYMFIQNGAMTGRSQYDLGIAYLF